MSLPLIDFFITRTICGLNNIHPRNDYLMLFPTSYNHTLLQRPSKNYSPKASLVLFPKPMTAYANQAPFLWKHTTQRINFAIRLQGADFSRKSQDLQNNQATKRVSASYVNQRPSTSSKNLSICNSYFHLPMDCKTRIFYLQSFGKPSSLIAKAHSINNWRHPTPTRNHQPYFCNSYLTTNELQKPIHTPDSG